MTTSTSKPANTANRLPDGVLERIKDDRIIGIRAGKESTHRTIGVWVVVVDGRIFVRSWSMKPRSWWRTLLKDPYATIFVSRRKRGIQVRARQIRSEKLKDRVSDAYREKYNTRGSVGYVEDMSRKPSRDTTTELVPL